MEGSVLYFALKNSLGHTEEFVWNL